MILILLIHSAFLSLRVAPGSTQTEFKGVNFFLIWSRCPWWVSSCGIQFICNLSEDIKGDSESLCPGLVQKLCEYTEIMRAVPLSSRVFSTHFTVGLKWCQNELTWWFQADVCNVRVRLDLLYLCRLILCPTETFDEYDFNIKPRN